MVRFRWGRYLTDVHVGFSPSKPRICNTQIFLWGRRLGELWAISVRSAWHSTRGNVKLRHPWKCLITSLAVLPLSSHRPWTWIRLIISITECLLTLLRGVAVPGKTQLCSIEKKTFDRICSVGFWNFETFTSLASQTCYNFTMSFYCVVSSGWISFSSYRLKQSNVICRKSPYCVIYKWGQY